MENITNQDKTQTDAKESLSPMKAWMIAKISMTEELLIELKEKER